MVIENHFELGKFVEKTENDKEQQRIEETIASEILTNKNVDVVNNDNVNNVVEDDLPF